MTIVAVMAVPPVPGAVLPELTESLLAPDESARLYRAMLADVCRSVQSTGADLLVNYRPPDQLPDGDDPEDRLREALVDLLEAPDSVRYEVQVGDTWSGRVGNTVTHLLEQEERDSVVVVRPTAAFLSREELGAAGMKLRSNGVVLGPDTTGGVYLAGFAENVDFAGAYGAPALETLTDRGIAADHEVDFLRTLPVFESRRSLVPALSALAARRCAGRKVPAATAAVVEELGLSVGVVDGELSARRDN